MTVFITIISIVQEEFHMCTNNEGPNLKKRKLLRYYIIELFFIKKGNFSYIPKDIDT